MKKDDATKRALALHKKLGGKIGTEAKAKVRSRNDLSLVYTPGVAAVSSAIAKNKKLARMYTIKRNTVAVISDGSAVLGLGNIGPEAALPVMEGKALIFKEFAGVDAFPIVLATQDTDEIVETVNRIAPTFGGINLEDIAAPRCFEIEDRLKKELPIPVIHDDQHGTAIVVLAGLINACKVTKRDLKKARVVIAGAGAAGTATAKLLRHFGVRNIIVTDRKGIISKKRRGISGYKKALAEITNAEYKVGQLSDALEGADIVIGVSGPKCMGAQDIARMNKKAIVFALANPIPEITPEKAKKGEAAVIATGRSDYPNQINNALVFPGLFRGALDRGVRDITDDMKVKAAKKLAGMVKKPTASRIIPDLFDKRVVKAVASAIR